MKKRYDYCDTKNEFMNYSNSNDYQFWYQELAGQYHRSNLRIYNDAINNIENTCYNLIPKSVNEYDNKARDLLCGIIIYLCRIYNYPFSLAYILSFTRDKDVICNIAGILDSLKNNIHPFGAVQLMIFMNYTYQERIKIVEILNTYLDVI